MRKSYGLIEISGVVAALDALDTGRLIARAFAASTAAVTAATSPSTMIVTSLPPSFLSQVASVTSAALHMISSASSAATTPDISIRPYDFLMHLHSCLRW